MLTFITSTPVCLPIRTRSASLLPPAMTSHPVSRRAFTFATISTLAIPLLPNHAQSFTNPFQQPTTTTTTPTAATDQKLRTRVFSLVHQDPTIAATLLRLAFHDSFTTDLATRVGGSNGSIRLEINRPENFGLSRAVDALKPVQEDTAMSWGDVVAVAGAVAVEATGGPRIDLQLGRENASVQDPRGALPSPAETVDELRKRFQPRGFDDRDLVALSGAHTLGKVTGAGPFVAEPNRFQNDYFKNLIWFENRREDVRSEKTGPPEKPNFQLPSDMHLLDDPKTLAVVREFANDQDAFFKQFVKSYRKMVNLDIPKIDFSPFMHLEGAVIGQPPTAAQRSTAAAINAAFANHGFLFLSSIGITPQQLASYFSMTSSVFSLPHAHKRTKFIPLDPIVNIGYKPRGTETLNTKRPYDIKEIYNVRNTRLFDHDFSALPPSAEPALRDLWHHIETTAHRFALACALALDLPPTFFTRVLQSYNSSIIRLNYYPPTDYNPLLSTGESLTSPIRVGEHTDFGMFTMLFTDAPGLQVKAVEGGEIGGKAHGEIGGWLDVPVPGEATAIVNTGAMIARWTNDVWKATAHRVIVADAEQAMRERYSIACFFDPDAEFVIEVHPKFVPKGEKPKYAPISVGDYEKGRLSEVQVELGQREGVGYP